jgi:hypothetical protein
MSVTELRNAVRRMSYEQFAAWCALAAVSLASATGALAVLAGLWGVVAAAPIFVKPTASYTVTGTVTTSDGKKYAGTLYTTQGKPLRIYDRGKKDYVEFALKETSRIDVSIEEEHEEPYWYWKESGSDVKVFTGNTYPWRKYITTVTLLGGRTITGDLDGLIYAEVASPVGANVQTTDAPQETGPRKYSFLFHERQKGEEKQRPADLVYVTAVVIEGKAK